MTNIQVINNWLIGKDGQSGSMRSEDGKLFSYNLPIAIRTAAFQHQAKWYDVYDYDIDTIEEKTGYRSMTTRQHIGLVTRALLNTKRRFTIHTYRYGNEEIEYRNVPVTTHILSLKHI